MIDHRTRTAAAILTLACALLLATGALAGGLTSPLDGVWVDGVVHNLAVTGPAPAGAHAIPLYVIAPVDAEHPLHPVADAKTHGFGAHDHVTGLANPYATFHGACDLTLVVPGAKGTLGSSIEGRHTLTPAGTRPLLYAARLGSKLLPLTSAARIVKAEHAGLAGLVDTHTAVACTVSPRANG